MFVKFVATLLAVFLTVANAGLDGAPENADINSPEVQNALSFAVAQYNSESDSIYIQKVVKVIKAQVQVVSGVNYIFTVEMANTSCKKEKPEETCAINSDPDLAKSHECKLTVWSQPWMMDSMKLIENTC
ncbi:cystatin-like [Tachysurus fulvidraco]|uniref:cystatin-like n=1 Tax=Tachysurus fulvidraco TaxID=1234273 RepID=UPI000F4DBE2D|nr:cystatin-like [Tachysurus fulvidraco]